MSLSTTFQVIFKVKNVIFQDQISQFWLFLGYGDFLKGYIYDHEIRFGGSEDGEFNSVIFNST